MTETLTIETVREAQRRIAPYVLRTPLLRHAPRGDCELLLKPESLQATGAFKLRNGMPVTVDNTLAPEFEIAPNPENR